MRTFTYLDRPYQLAVKQLDLVELADILDHDQVDMDNQLAAVVRVGIVDRVGIDAEAVADNVFVAPNGVVALALALHAVELPRK